MNLEATFPRVSRRKGHFANVGDVIIYPALVWPGLVLIPFWVFWLRFLRAQDAVHDITPIFDCHKIISALTTPPTIPPPTPSLVETSLNLMNFFVSVRNQELNRHELSLQGLRRGRGWEGQGPPPPELFEKRNNKFKKYAFSNKRNLWWNTNIRLADQAEASKFMIGPFRSYIIRWAQERMRYLLLSWLV